MLNKDTDVPASTVITTTNIPSTITVSNSPLANMSSRLKRHRLWRAAATTCQVDFSTARGRNHNGELDRVDHSLQSNNAGKSNEMKPLNVVSNISCRQPKGNHIPVIGDIGKGGLAASNEHVDVEVGRTDAIANQPFALDAPIRDLIKFCKLHTAVLESIKFRGELRVAFEEECKVPWYDPEGFEDDQLIPSTRWIRVKPRNCCKRWLRIQVQWLKDQDEPGGTRGSRGCHNVEPRT